MILSFESRSWIGNHNKSWIDHASSNDHLNHDFCGWISGLVVVTRTWPLHPHSVKWCIAGKRRHHRSHRLWICHKKRKHVVSPVLDMERLPSNIRSSVTLKSILVHVQHDGIVIWSLTRRSYNLWSFGWYDEWRCAVRPALFFSNFDIHCILFGQTTT